MDERRFSRPDELSDYQVTHIGSLSGDAQLVSGDGRGGLVYRKTFEDEVVFTKVATTLREWDEIYQEWNAYNILRELQGRYIPSVVSLREFMNGGTLALSTAKLGRPILRITEDEAQKARDLLYKIHALGVVHGDLKNSNNIVKYIGDDGESVIGFIDFGMSKFKVDLGREFGMACDDDWTDLSEALASVTCSDQDLDGSQIANDSDDSDKMISDEVVRTEDERDRFLIHFS